MTNPSISVLMPAYNTEKYVGEAIESVLNQTFKDFEFIIIDDGSTDKTWEIIQEYAKKDNRIVALKNETNLKICKTLNRGIEIAKGKYIARMDADDWSYPDRLERQFVFMESNPNVVISGGTMEVCDESLNVLNRRRYNLTDTEIRKKLFRYSPFCHATTIMKTELVKSVQGYNSELHGAEDYDLYFRLGSYGHFANLADVLYKMRVNTNGICLSDIKKQEYLTLFIRIKSIVEYGYQMGWLDKLYLVGQYISTYLLPPRLKYRLFNLLRSL